MSVIAAPATRPLDPLKFRDPLVTAKGETRATVALSALRTLWVNTGTLCNITCRNCYIESSPKNDALAYLTAAELREYLDEIARDALPVEEIGFTGCLMTDDIGMEALSGTMAERAAASLAAGVDLVLHCKGDRPGMEQAVSGTHALVGDALERTTRALAHRRSPEPVDLDALALELAALVPEES